MSASFQNRYHRAKSAKINSSDNKFMNTNQQINHMKNRRTQSSFNEEQIQQTNLKGINTQSNFFDNRQSRLRQKSKKQPEQIIEQNFHLKNQLHALNKKFMIQKGKIQVQRKRNNIYSKKLNRQFQKQLYWQSNKNNDYLITGIKHQYEKMKQMYQQKCKQCQQIKKTLSSTQMEELIHYCESLQTQNKILIENLSYLKMNNKKSNSNKQFGFEKNQRLKSKIQRLQQKLTKYLNKQRQLEKKVTFLEKAIIQKDNNTHFSYRKQKATKKQNDRLMTIVKQLQVKILQIQQKFKIDIENFQNLNKKKVVIEKQMFEKSIKEKNDHILKLEKQIGYLSTLLSYWKPLDELNLKDNSDTNKSSLKQKNSSMKLKQPNNSQSFNQSLNNKAKTPNKPIESQKYIINDLKILNEQQYNFSKDISSNSILMDEDILKSNKTNSNKQARRSNKKWCEEAKKSRKVNQSQIQHLGQLIKYKMIGQNKNIDHVKQQFSKKIDGISSPNLSEQLMTMKQINYILKSNPFNLLEQDAFKLSRYLAEDQGGEYVYFHQDNQIQRSIVKSILKTLIGQYDIPNYQECQHKWVNVKKSYCYNMQLALKSIYPKGIISKNKLIELFKSLGIQIQDDLKNYIVGKLITDAPSLSELNYQSLFTAEEQIN